MSNALVPATTTVQPTRTARRTGQALEKVHGHQAVATAEEVAKVELMADVTEAALLAASHISALEVLLSNRTPQAEERLRHIADAGALSLTEVVFRASRRCL